MTGGGIQASVSSVMLSGRVNISDNYAAMGGAVFANQCTMRIEDGVTLNDNQVSLYSGGLMVWFGLDTKLSNVEIAR